MWQLLPSTAGPRSVPLLRTVGSFGVNVTFSMMDIIAGQLVAVDVDSDQGHLFPPNPVASVRRPRQQAHVVMPTRPSSWH